MDIFCGYNKSIFWPFLTDFAHFESGHAHFFSDQNEILKNFTDEFLSGKSLWPLFAHFLPTFCPLLRGKNGHEKVFIVGTIM